MYGGAISVVGTAGVTYNISTSTFNGNSVTGGGGTDTGGGAIYLYGGILNITNCTFANNSTTGTGTLGGLGGALYVEGGSANVAHCTLSGNSATSGGGIYNGGSVTLKNTIVANSTGGNCSGTITNGGYNLVWGDTSCPGTNADPKLLALANNGGPTQTFALNTGSAASEQIPSGTNGCGTTYTTDQRGYVRPGTKNDQINKKCEIGAWEAQISDPTAITLREFAARTGARSPLSGKQVMWGIGLILVICLGLILLGRKRPT
jgi:predicted outer membrane repeat protein